MHGTNFKIRVTDLVEMVSPRQSELCWSLLPLECYARTLAIRVYVLQCCVLGLIYQKILITIDGALWRCEPDIANPPECRH